MQIENKKPIKIALAGLGILVILLFFLFSSARHGQSAKSALQAQQNSFASSSIPNPILQHLPYGDYGYNITPTYKYIGGKNTLVLLVTIKFYDSDYRASSTDQEQYISDRKNQALQYIKSLGFDPNNYHIEYINP